MEISVQTYRDLRELGQENGLGVSLDESEFKSLQPWRLFQLQGIESSTQFSDLDANGDGRITDRDLSNSDDRRYVRTGDERFLNEEAAPREPSRNDSPTKHTDEDTNQDITRHPKPISGEFTMNVGADEVGVTPVQNLQGNSSKMQTLDLPSNTDYVVVTVSHGNGAANELHDRFIPETNNNLKLLGYTGGDDKVILLFEVRDASKAVKLDYQGGGGAKAFALDTGNQPLHIAGGRGVTNQRIEAPEKSNHFIIGASDAGAKHGKTFGRGDDTVYFFDRDDGDYKERGAFMELRLG